MCVNYLQAEDVAGVYPSESKYRECVRLCQHMNRVYDVGWRGMESRKERQEYRETREGGGSPTSSIPLPLSQTPITKEGNVADADTNATLLLTLHVRHL